MNNIKEKFLKWEKEKQLYSYTYDGFPVWNFIRVNLFMAIQNQDFNLSQMKRESLVVKTPFTLRSKIKVIINSLKFLLKISKLRKTDILIISKVFNRILLNNKYFDKYFDQISIPSQNITLLEYPDLMNPNLHYKNNYNQDWIIPADFIYLLEFIQFKFKKKKYNHIDTLFNLYSIFIYENFGYKVSEKDFIYQVEKLINRQITRMNIYQKLIYFIKPKAIILKSSYDPMSQLVQFNANKLNIPTIELQHGHIYRDHPGYFKSNNIASPKYIFVESTFYQSILIDNGWNKNQVLVVGEIIKQKNSENSYKFLEELIHKNIKSINDKIVVTIINQHTLSKEISSFLQNLDSLEKYVFLIKLHPRFIDDQKEFFKESLKFSNVILVPPQYTVEACFALSKICIGVYSTALIDALKKNLNVFIMNLPGANFMDDLIEKNIAIKINNIIDILEYDQLNNSNFFTHSFNENKLNNNIQEIFSNKYDL